MLYFRLGVDVCGVCIIFITLVSENLNSPLHRMYMYIISALNKYVNKVQFTIYLFNDFDYTILSRLLFTKTSMWMRVCVRVCVCESVCVRVCVCEGVCVRACV